jgi:hypothetical protein
MPISEILRADVDRTLDEYNKAKQNFWLIAADVPSGLPHPDGMQRVRNASRAQTFAMDAYATALKRLNQFLISGTIPDDLRESVCKHYDPPGPESLAAKA